MTFVVDATDINETGNGDVCIRTDKGTLVALVYAADGTLDRANLIAEALNTAAHRAMTAARLLTCPSCGKRSSATEDAMKWMTQRGTALQSAKDAALRIASDELSRLLFNAPSERTHKALDAVDTVLLAQARAEAALKRNPMTEAPAKGLPASLREWAGNYEEGSFDTEEGLMIEAAEAIEALTEENRMLRTTAEVSKP